MIYTEISICDAQLVLLKVCIIFTFHN